jgi:S-adenosylmethionine:tRNA ribosyltransferase-isomerase
MLVIDRKTGSIKHHRFFEVIDFLREGDVLVYNESRVIPARLIGKKSGSGGRVEILLLLRTGDGVWDALVRPGKRVSPGTIIEFFADGIYLTAEVSGIKEGGIKVLKFSDERLIMKVGKIALPPYIHSPLLNYERYQTIYSRIEGSVAAPTAGLHFTPELFREIKNKSVICVPVTLHVGLDTFQPVREDDPQHHIIHREYGIMSDETASQISKAKLEGRRVICVGTTAVRTVEHVAASGIPLNPFSGWIDLFILPGHKFLAVDAMITNFHLPETTLLMLVSAFSGKELIYGAYAEAIKGKYRFYSFGDAMLIL